MADTAHRKPFTCALQGKPLPVHSSPGLCPFLLLLPVTHPAGSAAGLLPSGSLPGLLSPSWMRFWLVLGHPMLPEVRDSNSPPHCLSPCGLVAGVAVEPASDFRADSRKGLLERGSWPLGKIPKESMGSHCLLSSGVETQVNPAHVVMKKRVSPS